MTDSDIKKLKALSIDNYACVPQPAWYWNCDNCPIRSMFGEVKGSCADGKAQQEAIRRLRSVDDE